MNICEEVRQMFTELEVNCLDLSNFWRQAKSSADLLRLKNKKRIVFKQLIQIKEYIKKVMTDEIDGWILALQDEGRLKLEAVGIKNDKFCFDPRGYFIYNSNLNPFTIRNRTVYSLPRSLKKVKGFVLLDREGINSIGNLEYVGGFFSIQRTLISSLGNLKFIKGDAFFADTALKTIPDDLEIMGYVEVSYDNRELILKLFEQKEKGKIHGSIIDNVTKNELFLSDYC